MGQLCAKRHLSYSRLRQASILNVITFLLGLEPDHISPRLHIAVSETLLLDRKEFFLRIRRYSCWKLNLGSILGDGLVHSSICTATDEADNVIFLIDLDF